MKYTLFTGATGLLGAYLMRDGMLAGRQFAVLVRPGKTETAAGRIESVLARFENEQKITLPRPVVLEGSLSSPDLGLSKDNQAWAAAHCDEILHNAASLVFYADEKTGEPDRSNIDGTRNVLVFAKESGIRIFHHVSTAYVCGLRQDLCMENQLDVGQEFGNDYERSKVAAEKMIRTTDFLDSLTVYRPAIIIGDATTGYTSTYHGFFTPLKVAHVFAANSRDTTFDGGPLLHSLGFSGKERKNFVPVDWVSAMMVHVMQRKNLWNNTYNLVPRNKTGVDTTTKVFVDALEEFYRNNKSSTSQATKKSPQPSFTTPEMLEMFRSQMSVYESYWRDDPTFDYTNTTNAAPHLPCPTVDYSMLMRMAKFALANGFGWPKPRPIVPHVSVHDRLAKKYNVSSNSASLNGKIVGVQINGPGGGQWTAMLDPAFRKVLGITQGLPIETAPLLYFNTNTFLHIAEQRMTPHEALTSGAVVIELGSSLTETQFREFTSEIFEALLASLII